jgi:hypothetical protein
MERKRIKQSSKVRIGKETKRNWRPVVAPAFSKIWRRMFKVQKKFIKLIRNPEVPVDDFVDDILAWLNKPECSYEPYAALVKMALGIGYHQRRGKIDGWNDVFPRVQRIVKISDKRGSPFARTILNESMGHRYLDMWLQTKDSQYEILMKQSYLRAHKAAKKGRYPKNIDSTIFWMAAAYERAGEQDMARQYYAEVAKAGGRFKQGLHMKKIRAAKKRADCPDLSKLKPIMKVI